MSRRSRHSRHSFLLLEVAISLVFAGMVGHHVINSDFRPLAALCAPILLVYFAFASLLFVRGRALANGPWQLRSLHAAERAMQAAVWHLLGVVLGVIVYGLVRQIGVDSDHGGLELTLRLVFFAAPYALMQAGLLSFLRAIWTIAPQLSRPVSAFEVRRRVLSVAAEPSRGCAVPAR